MAGNTGWSVNATWFKMARQPLLMLKGASAKDRAKGAKTSMRLALKLAFALRGSMAAVVVSAVLVAGQARPFPGPDVQQIYQRLLPQIEKISAFDHHAHPGFADDPDRPRLLQQDSR